MSLSSSPLDLGRMPDPQGRLGSRPRRDHDRGALGGQGVAGDHVGQLGHRADVADRQLVDGQLLLAAQGEGGVDPLVGVGADVDQDVVAA